MSIPLTWPNGIYGLPKPAKGCPSAGPSPGNFEWNLGKAYWKYGYSLSGGNHFESGSSTQWLHYCVKTVDDPNAMLDWPPGEYCIMMKGKECPTGMYVGSLV